MILAGLTIFFLELAAIIALFVKYFGPYAGPATIEEFIREASFEDIIRLTIHQRMMFFGLCIATMGKLFQ